MDDSPRARGKGSIWWGAQRDGEFTERESAEVHPCQFKPLQTDFIKSPPEFVHRRGESNPNMLLTAGPVGVAIQFSQKPKASKRQLLEVSWSSFEII